MDYFSNRSPTASSSQLPPSDGPSSPLDSPQTPPADPNFFNSNQLLQVTPPQDVDESRPKSRILSPGQLVTVLQKRTPAPAAHARFLHGGPPLSDLSAASAVLASATSSATPVSSTASAWWRAFTDEEEGRLQKAWEMLDVDERMGGTRKTNSPKKGQEENEVSDPDSELQEHIVPVGLDSLFSVDLLRAILFPDFWTGAPVQVILSTWFYAPPTPYGSTPSHQVKAYPVDVALAASLEKAYSEAIRPWEDSYTAELASALKVGPEAEAKLRVPVVVRGAASGFEVIFQGKDWGRIYSTGVLGSLGKSYKSGSKGHGGGQVVLRGWEAVREWRNDAKKKRSPASLQTNDGYASSAAADSDQETSSPTASPAPRSRTSSSSATLKPSVSSGGLGSAFLSSLRNKMGGAVAPQPETSAKVSEQTNSTEEAMAGPRNTMEGVEVEEGGVGEVNELVLVVHGIGQKLAGTYESFNFVREVHAVNSLRTNCTTQSTSPSLAPLIHSRRAQFIPVKWRTDLNFDEIDESEDTADENLDNRFSLDDIEIKESVPLLRQMVSGLVLDVPFYLSPHHKTKMLKAVVKDANRIYRLFCARNPNFAANGKVSIVAHSLGSTLCADILSTQPTFVKPLSEMTLEEKRTEAHFVFDTRVLILVGSPLAFFLHLGKGQLVARKGRERSKNVAPDVALDRPRYGCLAIDCLYNVFAEADPVAFSLNATVDVKYSRLIKPIAIPSTNVTLMQNLSETYLRVSKMFNVSSLWASGETKAVEVAEAAEEKVHQQQKVEADAAEAIEAKDKVLKMPAGKAAVRPGKGMKRMPSERPMPKQEFIKIERAEKRFKALNPRGCLDFYLPSEGYNQYVDALSAHGSYWFDTRFATFCLLSLFASEEDLERTGREELGSEVE
ncbi:hypothetical protein P7C70_g3817, partial [Phenoliferia sp. Uapishka_3]